MIFRVVITEYDDFANAPGARVLRAQEQIGTALDVLEAAVVHANSPDQFRMMIQRDPDTGQPVKLADLVEVARGIATAPQDRHRWIQAMAKLIDGWVYPWDDGHPIIPPPQSYWEHAGLAWANLVAIPPPDDLIAYLDKYDHYCGYGSFVRTGRTADPSKLHAQTARSDAPTTRGGGQG